MKKYEYVPVHIGKFCGAKSEEHRKIIDDYAKKGYRGIYSDCYDRLRKNQGYGLDF